MGAWVRVFTTRECSRFPLGAAAPHAARQPRGRGRVGEFRLKGMTAITDKAHGLGARRGRLCESEKWTIVLLIWMF